MKSPRSGLNWIRGLRGTAAGAIFGAMAPIVELGFATFVPWLIWDASASDRGLDVAWLTDRLPPSVICCSLLCACTGWSTFAPRGKHSFALTLVVVGLISYFVFATVEAIAPRPQALKGQEHPPLAVWRLILLPSIPISISVILSCIRAIPPASETDSMDTAHL